ncbi:MULTISPECIES: phosphoglycolate phosphatase [Stutzerimonas stutzeri group]|jgi:phosphoglycolate phosphatase|uniref:Phosphoglycolate phosphatase n=1 Tax=Stutzerimonas stutzeri TaxID=316 RepID=A0AA40RNQ6_STUST|nr:MULTISPECIES: phosphoglycolate phosphatase [Stutzerimonas stutzeri group]MBS67983.1 phosphoglycolate phosphatase [Pseudomonas sp.]AKN25615.1 phosphoglycolate phosphatase [Stutzerimonas stutzeri]KXO81110.1 phosphoglycolate phosphatase [Stutzerimonas stutzeri]MBA1302792.1 phosphoglycolate phosphatase [Stutzerimonas stutzeri]MBO0640157.1 phosphoglycolate phosphatase [Stutzerimonas stutzeri]|tara:strand:- start:657 stop:1358 length:702 start_codon:yes stop_codon:yes gene_type:complete
MTRLEQLFDGTLPRLVMFDLDGTLMDSVPDLAAAVDKMLMLLGREPAGIERVRDWVGNGSRVLVRRALAGQLDHDGVADELADEALALFMQAYAGGHELTAVYPGVRDCLDWLRERRVKLAIITNKPAQFIEPLLEEKGLAGYFDWLVGGDTLPQQKPDPAALFWVMDKAGVAPSESLFVGDSRNDVRAAKAATVRCVALTYGYNHGEPIADEQPALVLDDLRELVASVPGLR